MRLYIYINAAGGPHNGVLYCDTDSMILTNAAFKTLNENMPGCIDNAILGRLK